MFEVQTSSGMLRNTDSGNPMVPIGQSPTSTPPPPPPPPHLPTLSAVVLACLEAMSLKVVANPLLCTYVNLPIAQSLVFLM